MISSEQLYWARIAAAVFALLIVNQGIGIWRFRRKASKGLKWPSTEGKIIASSVETTSVDQETRDERSSVSVSYSYAVDGKSYKGSRIGWGKKAVMLTPAAQTLSMRYPVGATVPVFYDPRKPGSSLLEPRARSNSVAMTAMTLFLIVFSAIEIGVLPLALLGYNPSTANGMPFFGFMLPLACIAVSVISFFSYFRLRRVVAASRHWPKAAGQIVSASVSTIYETPQVDTESTISRTTKKYRADIRYTYRVGQSDFSATALNLGGLPLYGFARDAEAVTAQYPVGTHVDVYHDPANPEVAILRPEDKGGTLSPLIFGAIFGVGGAIFLWAFATMQVASRS